jgi:hypothetical protein
MHEGVGPTYPIVVPHIICNHGDNVWPERSAFRNTQKQEHMAYVVHICVDWTPNHSPVLPGSTASVRQYNRVRFLWESGRESGRPLFFFSLPHTPGCVPPLSRLLALPAWCCCLPGPGARVAKWQDLFHWVLTCKSTSENRISIPTFTTEEGPGAAVWYRGGTTGPPSTRL